MATTPPDKDTVSQVRAWRREAFRDVLSLSQEERRQAEAEVAKRLGLRVQPVSESVTGRRAPEKKAG